MLSLLPEDPLDRPAVAEVVRLAFDSEAEPRLVETIRRSPGFIPELSIVAKEDGEVVGHILFSRIVLRTPAAETPALSLAPMAVRPDRQRQGIGTDLAGFGLQECWRLGHRIVIVLGHPDYYPRFGFRPASGWGLKCKFPAPDEALMAIERPAGSIPRGAEIAFPEYFDEFV